MQSSAGRGGAGDSSRHSDAVGRGAERRGAICKHGARLFARSCLGGQLGDIIHSSSQQGYDTEKLSKEMKFSKMIA